MPNVISLRQDIGEYDGAMSASEFISQLERIEQAAEEVILRVNSMGGSVFESLSMMAALNRSPSRIIAEVEGVAASAAGFLIVGGADQIQMHESAFLMLHLAVSGVIGNRQDMQAQAEVLNQIDSMIANIFAKRAGGSPTEWMSLLERETWLEAAEVEALGLGTVIANTNGQPAPQQIAKARRNIANRSVRTAAFLNSLMQAPRRPTTTTRTTAAALANYADRVAQLQREAIEAQREDNRETIVANARDRGHALRYLAWS